MQNTTPTAAYRYGLKLAIVYSVIWFVDLLDASLLNVALPKIASFFQVDPTHAEWTIVGFLLAMTVGMAASHAMTAFMDAKRAYLFAQILYIAASIGCGASSSLPELIFFRIFQGLGGGLTIPLGMSLLLSNMPQEKWAKTSSSMNIFSLMAPALGPIIAGYIMTYFSWRWLFFIKIPLSILCLFLTYVWVKKEPLEKDRKFDGWGLFLAALSLSSLLIVLTEIGKEKSLFLLIFLFLFSIFTGLIFFRWEKKYSHPLMPLKIFKNPLFSYGNIIQSAANMIFLGATFIIALYFQQGLGIDIIHTGWIMSAITLGMLSVMPLVGTYYNRLGPLPFIIPGLLIMAFTMVAFMFTTPDTSYYFLALLIFLEGAGSSLVQLPNMMSIFSDISPSLKGTASSLYSIFKQLSASLGVAITTMTLSIGLAYSHLQKVDEIGIEHRFLFHICFAVLAIIPLLALICCFFIDNTIALRRLKKDPDLKPASESERG